MSIEMFLGFVGMVFFGIVIWAGFTRTPITEVLSDLKDWIVDLFGRLR